MFRGRHRDASGRVCNADRVCNFDRSLVYANNISDIAPPGGIIGITASSLGITTSISTGPGVANASFIVLARSFDFSMRKPRAPYASASLTKFGTDIAEYEYRSA